MAKTGKKAHKKSPPPIPSWVWVLITAALVPIIAGLYWISRPQTESGLPSEISIDQAVALQAGGAFLLDVRQPDEWEEVHIEGSTLIPLDQLEASLNELPRDRQIVVVCRSGNRSAQGRDILLDAGFSQVASMAGGVSQWAAAGYPTVSGP